MQHQHCLPAQKIWTSQWLHIGLLIALVLACFCRVLTSYFLADDIGEIAYVAGREFSTDIRSCSG